MCTNGGCVVRVDTKVVVGECGDHLAPLAKTIGGIWNHVGSPHNGLPGLDPGSVDQLEMLKSARPPYPFAHHMKLGGIFLA